MERLDPPPLPPRVPPAGSPRNTGAGAVERDIAAASAALTPIIRLTGVPFFPLAAGNGKISRAAGFPPPPPPPEEPTSGRRRLLVVIPAPPPRLACPADAPPPLAAIVTPLPRTEVSPNGACPATAVARLSPESTAPLLDRPPKLPDALLDEVLPLASPIPLPAAVVLNNPTLRATGTGFAADAVESSVEEVAPNPAPPKSLGGDLLVTLTGPNPEVAGTNPSGGLLLRPPNPALLLWPNASVPQAFLNDGSARLAASANDPPLILLLLLLLLLVTANELKATGSEVPVWVPVPAPAVLPPNTVCEVSRARVEVSPKSLVILFRVVDPAPVAPLNPPPPPNPPPPKSPFVPKLDRAGATAGDAAVFHATADVLAASIPVVSLPVAD